MRYGDQHPELRRLGRSRNDGRSWPATQRRRAGTASSSGTTFGSAPRRCRSQDPWVLMAAIAADDRADRHRTDGHAAPASTPVGRGAPGGLARPPLERADDARGRDRRAGRHRARRVRRADRAEGARRQARRGPGDHGPACGAARSSASAGTHYQLGPMTLPAAPGPAPRIPIIVAGYWPHRGPIRRAARWDGMNRALREADRGAGRRNRARLVAELRALRSDHAVDGAVRDTSTGATDAG